MGDDDVMDINILFDCHLDPLAILLSRGVLVYDLSAFPPS